MCWPLQLTFDKIQVFMCWVYNHIFCASLSSGSLTLWAWAEKCRVKKISDKSATQCCKNLLHGTVFLLKAPKVYPSFHHLINAITTLAQGWTKLCHWTYSRLFPESYSVDSLVWCQSSEPPLLCNCRYSSVADEPVQCSSYRRRTTKFNVIIRIFRLARMTLVTILRVFQSKRRNSV